MGRRNTARRRLAGAGTGTGLAAGSSEPNLEIKGPISGFPPGTTVDELRLFSRRKANNANHNQDNVFHESGSLKDITSEYTRCFRAPPVATYSLGDLTDHANEPKKITTMRRFSSQSEDMNIKFRNSEPGLANNRWHRPSKEQHLKLEGEMLFQTENGDEFIEYVLGKRPDLLRRQTQLKLEGDVCSMTENREKYVQFENCQRPPLAKRNTNLHLEGDQLYVPEYKEFFVEFPRKRPTVKRPSPWLHVDSEAKMDWGSETLTQFVEHILTGNKSEILRRPSNLKCEGDIALMPEYKDSFRKYPIAGRQFATRQLSNLKPEGQLYANPEYRDKYTTFPSVRLKPIKHFDTFQLGEKTHVHSVEPPQSSVNLNLATESGITVSTDKPPTPTKTLHKSTVTKSDHTATSHKKYSPTTYTTMKPTQHTDTHLEERLTARPPRSSRSRAPSQASNRRDPQRSETPKRYTEVNTETNPRQPSTHRWARQPYTRTSEYADENIESKPEYRKAYLDYLIREKLPNRLPPEPELDKTVVKMSENQPSLQSTKKSVSEDRKLSASNNNLTVYKPTLRRGSAGSTHSSPRRRSVSPSYKMLVTNVDEPKVGFSRPPQSPQRSKVAQEYYSTKEPPSIEYISQGENFKNSNRSNWIRSSAQTNDDIDYNNKLHNRNDRSFVVLENGREASKTRRKWESPWWQSTYN